MGKIFQELFNDFSGGLTEEKRSQDPRKFSITKHFDTFTYPHKLVPYVKTETSLGVAAGDVKSLKIKKFLYAQNQTSALFRLYGLGENASGKVKIYRIDVDASSNLDGESWVAATNGESSVGTRNENLFSYYKQYIYTFSGTTNLNRYDTLESVAFADAWQTLATTTDPIQPVYHPSDDCEYFFSDNVVYRLNGTSWDGAVLTLPSTMRIVAACADGNFLSIACVTLGNQNIRSTVFKWDRDSSLTTLTERIDFGEGKIAHLASLNNRLTAITNFYLDNAYGLRQGKLLVKQPSGIQAVIVNALTTDVPTTAPVKTNMVRDNKLYFPLKATLNGDDRFGIWACDENGKLALDFVEEQATSYEGIFATGNMWWIAHSGDGSVTRSDDDDGAFSTTLASVYESSIKNGGDSAVTKKLLSVTVDTEPLPAAGQIVLKYRKNEETSWTTIFTHTTDNSISHTAINIESSGATLPEFKEIQFRIESTGGAAITGWKYKAEVIDKDIA